MNTTLYRGAILASLTSREKEINLLADPSLKIIHMNAVDVYETVLHNIQSGASLEVIRAQFQHDIERLRKYPERVMVEKHKLEALKVFYGIFTILMDKEPEATLLSKMRSLRLRLKQELPSVQDMGESIVEHRGPCLGCETETNHFCPFCHSYGQVVMFLCEKDECLAKHEGPDGHGCYRTHFDATIVEDRRTGLERRLGDRRTAGSSLKEEG